MSIGIMVLDKKLSYLDKIRGSLNVLVAPIQYLVNTPFAIGGWVVENLSSRQALKAQRDSFEAKYYLAKAQNQKLDALEVENMRLRSLLDSAFRLTDSYTIAEILAVDLEPFTHTIVINKGTQENTETDRKVFEGQAVIDDEGIVGQIIDVGPYSSTVMLITDPNSAIPLQVNRANGIRAIARGNGSIDQLELMHIPNNADIKRGDKLVSSGLGQRYPANYPVAIVTKVIEDKTQPYATVYARPLARLAQIRNVLLVQPQKQKLLAEPPPQLSSDAADGKEKNKGARSGNSAQMTTQVESENDGTNAQ